MQFEDALKQIKGLHDSEVMNSDLALTIEFFLVFSRMEYALKKTGFNNCGNPNWDTFHNFTRLDKISEEDDPNLKSAVIYYTGNSRPRVQQTDPQNFVAYEPESQSLLLQLRVVRNNLFHGGKRIVGRDADSDDSPDPNICRDRLFLKHGLLILEKARERCKCVNNAYTEHNNQSEDSCPKQSLKSCTTNVNQEGAIASELSSCKTPSM